MVILEKINIPELKELREQTEEGLNYYLKKQRADIITEMRCAAKQGKSEITRRMILDCEFLKELEEKGYKYYIIPDFLDQKSGGVTIKWEEKDE